MAALVMRAPPKRRLSTIQALTSPLARQLDASIPSASLYIAVAAANALTQRIGEGRAAA
jgi:hypothetical protein